MAQRALAEDHLRNNWRNERNSWEDHLSNQGNDLHGPVSRQVGHGASRRVRPYLKNPLALAVMVIGLYLFTGYTTGFVKIASLYHQIDQTRREIASVQGKNQQLQKKIEDLNSPAYAEKVARETLGLIKKGEVKYMVAEPMDKRDPSYLEVQKRPDSEKADNFY